MAKIRALSIIMDAVATGKYLVCIVDRH
jgi:hypothetical protein